MTATWKTRSLNIIIGISHYTSNINENILPKRATMPNLTFFNELEPPKLRALFAEDDLLKILQDLQAGVSLGILDFSPERAEVARRLNQAGIPLTAWLLLPKEQGYWFNLDNAEQAAQRYATFKAWSEEHGLRWQAVGLDIEPDINQLQALAASRLRGLRQFLRRANRQRLERGRERYLDLVRRIRADGFLVESYQFPFIIDERKAGSGLVQRLSGVLDLPVNREVLMLYTSFTPSIGPGLLWSYGRQAGGIGLGSTGGGVTMEGLVNTRPLTWEQFQRDLLLAAQLSSEVYIFSLEGCASQGFLPRLLGFHWDQPVVIPHGKARTIRLARALFSVVLKLSRLFI